MARKRALQADSRVLWHQCSDCGACLEKTPSGFLACPQGHGGLIVEDRTPVAASDLFSRRCSCGADLGNDPGNFCSPECEDGLWDS